MLGGGASSRLFQEIRERRGMAYAVYSYASHYRETGSVGIYVGTRGENVAECLERDRAARSASSPPGASTRTSCSARRTRMKGRLALSLESTAARMDRLGKRASCTDAELLDETRSRRASTP